MSKAPLQRLNGGRSQALFSHLSLGYKLTFMVLQRGHRTKRAWYQPTNGATASPSELPNGHSLTLSLFNFLWLRDMGKETNPLHQLASKSAHPLVGGQKPEIQSN